MENYLREALGDAFANLLHLNRGGAADGDESSAAAAAAANLFASVNPDPPMGFPTDRMEVPPASTQAIRQLPTIQVAPEDLMDENNRECCICFDEFSLKQQVKRLPCAHIFHDICIVDWLKRSCHCPICRYELETDDARYEQLRLERMQHRRLRFAQWELERMPVRQLQQIWKSIQPRSSSPTSNAALFVEKAELIQAIVSSPRVDIIHTPEPVSYALEDLKSMSIARLRETMHQSGVFFDPKDVVEKQDMLQIFINSGRLVLRAIEEEHETVLEQQSAEFIALSSKNNGNDNLDTTQRHSSLTVETVNSDEDDIYESTMINNSSASQSRRHSSSSTSGSFMEPIHQVRQHGEIRTGIEEANENLSMPPPPYDNNERTQTLETNTAPSMGSVSPESFENHDDMDGENDGFDNARQPHGNIQEEIRIGFFPYEERTISELQLLAKFVNIDVDHCLEKSDIIRHLREGPTFRSAVSHWSVSNLVALAREVHIDVSNLLFTSNNENNSSCQEDLVMALLQAARERRVVASYLNALIPLARLKASQLKDVAREQGITLSDCLQYEDMFHVLARRTPFDTAMDI